VEGGAYGGINGRNKGHQVAGFSTSYQKNESGNKATYYDDGLGHGGVIQYGAKDQRYNISRNSHNIISIDKASYKIKDIIKPLFRYTYEYNV